MSDWQTKDSGERTQFAGGGQRDTQAGKPRFDLCWPESVPYEDQLLTRFAALMGRGAEKYTDRNWEFFADKVALDRARGSALRHCLQWYNGEVDEDHAAAVIFNIMAAEYVRGILDGRWSPRQAEAKLTTLEDLYATVMTLPIPAELWTGTYADPEPPAYVNTLRLTNRGGSCTDRLFRQHDGKWAWSSDDGTGYGFFWPGERIPGNVLIYEFEEVREDG